MSAAADRAALLFANEAFYQAFATRDLKAMEALWSRAHPVACLHPGWPPLLERGDVIESWQRIFEGPAPPAVECLHAQALPYGETGLVVCYERIGNDHLIAANLFVREEGGWRLAAHQAGPVAAAPPPEEPDEDAASVH